MKEEENGLEKSIQKDVTNNHNHIKVNNAFNFTLTISDSLNLLGLIFGLLLLRKLFNRDQSK
jgi:hypothetical protein